MIYFWEVQIKEAYQHLQSALCAMYESREASHITDRVMEEITGWERSIRIIHHDHALSEPELEKFNAVKDELIHGRPVQYVLGYTWFAGMKLNVDERVLIPRPETEELVETVVSCCLHWDPDNSYQHKMIDIGTGSGCIAIALKKKFPEWEIWALDKSPAALELAKENASQNEAHIVFSETDILKEAKVDHLPAYDIIVSNPPYVPLKDKEEMSSHVLEHEPHLALFVANNNPLQFYISIIDFAYHHLLRGGMIFFETHEQYAQDVARRLEENDFEEVQVKKDMQGKERIVFGKRKGASL